MYLEINIIRKNRTVDNFYIDNNKKEFKYNKKTYKIDDNSIYVIPLKSGLIMPTVFFYEDKKNPLLFKKTNRGITGKAMSLLYNEKLYIQLFYPDVGKYNLFVVILSVALFIVYGIGIYLLYNWYQNGGV